MSKLKNTETSNMVAKDNGFKISEHGNKFWHCYLLTIHSSTNSSLSPRIYLYDGDKNIYLKGHLGGSVG